MSDEKPDYIEEIASILESLAASAQSCHEEQLSSSETLVSINRNLEDISYQMEVTHGRRSIMDRFEDAANEFNAIDRKVQAICAQLEETGVADVGQLPRDTRFDLYRMFPSCTEHECFITLAAPCGNCKSLIFANEELRHLHVHESKHKEKKRKTATEIMIK